MYGRTIGNTYYTNTNANDGAQWLMSFPDGIPGSTPAGPVGLYPGYFSGQSANFQVFTDGIGYYLNSPLRQRRIGASFIINTMLGINGDSSVFNGPTGNRQDNGVAYAQANFARWKALIQEFDNAYRPGIRSVEWNATTTTQPCGPNGAYTNIPPFSTPPYGLDPGFIQHPITPLTLPVVIFHNPDGSTYVLEKDCGNIAGRVQPLNSAGGNPVPPGIPPPLPLPPPPPPPPPTPAETVIMNGLLFTNPPPGFSNMGIDGTLAVPGGEKIPRY